MSSEEQAATPETSTTQMGIFHCTHCGKIAKVALTDPVPICCKEKMCLAFQEPR